MTACAIHISDLHRGTHEAPELDDALVTLCPRAAARARDRERRPLEPLPAGRARGGKGAARPAAGADPRRPRQPRHPLHPPRAHHEPVGALRGRVRDAPIPFFAPRTPSSAGSTRAVRGAIRAAGSVRSALASVGPILAGRTGRRVADRRLPPPPRGRALACLAEVPAQAPQHRAPRARGGGSRARARGAHPPGHGRRAARVRGARRRRSRAPSFSRPRRASDDRVPTGSARPTGSTSFAGRPTRSRSRRGSGGAAASSRQHETRSRMMNAHPVIRGCYCAAHHVTMRQPLEHFRRRGLGITRSRRAMMACAVVTGTAALLALAGSVAGAASSRPVIAFGSERGGPVRIAVVGLKPGQRVLPSSSAGMDVQPSWSPNGSRLAIATSDATGQDFDIATVAPNGTRPQEDHERCGLGREARLVTGRQVDRLRERPQRELRHLRHSPGRDRDAAADPEHLRGHRSLVVAGRIEASPSRAAAAASRTSGR